MGADRSWAEHFPVMAVMDMQRCPPSDMYLKEVLALLTHFSQGSGVGTRLGSQLSLVDIKIGQSGVDIKIGQS